MIGTSLGRYRILAPLGEGGMGRVYLAEDPTLARRVAIKVLPPEVAGDENLRQRLLVEARAASALNHPNILTIHDMGEADGKLYVAMELIEGRTLRDWAGGVARPASEVLALVRQATRALAAAHAAGLVHRDLKPENLMVRQDGLLKILDFGLARSVSPLHDGATMARTMPGTILGTAPYMSPEQVLGQAAGPASDVFSMGTLLYELVTGMHPFAAASAVETMHRILHETPPPSSTVVPGLPAGLDFVLAKAMARELARRYATAGDLDLDLEACEAGLSGARPHAAGGSPAATGPVSRAIAVLPFKNIGGSPDLDYLGVGLADAVITRLSSSPDLVVRATSSIVRYEKQAVDPRHVAQDLDVSVVLDASFQRAGSRFRATARLIEVPGGQALWAGKIDVDFDDIFAVQDDVAAGIVTALAARLGRAGTGVRYTPSPEVFEMYLRSQEPFRTGTREGFRRSIELMERAVEREPQYADAWAHLAKLRQSMVDSGLEADPSWYDKADEACRRALELDPQHSYARFSWGSLQLVRGRKREAYHAFVAHHRAQPNDFHALHYLAYVFRLCNLVDAALDAERTAIERDASAPWPYWMAIRIAFDTGRMDEGIHLLERARVRFPLIMATQAIELMLLRTQGRYAELLERAEQIAGSSPRDGQLQFERGYALARLGRLDEARRHADNVEPHAALDMDFAALLASLRAWLGDTDAAFAHLARAAELGNDSLYLYERNDLFSPLHGDPRWAPFLAGVRERAESYRAELRWPVG